jgi:imidazolonepropionase-like amidohydrolase
MSMNSEMHGSLRLITACTGVAITLWIASPETWQPRLLLLDNVRIIDGSGAPPIENGRIVIDGDRIVRAGPSATTSAPAGAETVDLAGRTVMPGLIDSHFHIEKDPKLALRQLSYGVTAFRDPGQWDEAFEELRRMIAANGVPGPRIFTTGPHIDGEAPAYPADSVVARDAEEARRHAEESIRRGATALKIYYRLPFASAKAVIAVCEVRRIPCTAHLELLDARELIAAGLHGIEHITSFGVSLLPRREAEAYRQAVLKNNDARRDGRYRVFAGADLEGAQAQALYSVLRERKPFLDATLAVFERRPPSPPAPPGFGGTSPPSPPAPPGFGATGPRPPTATPGFGATSPPSPPAPPGEQPDLAPMRVSGFAKMKQLARRAAKEGARIVVGGHTEVPFAGRGEAPWREMELLVESGFSPLEAISAATATAAAFLYRGNELGNLRAGFKADLVVLRGQPDRDVSAIRTVDRVMVGGRWVDTTRYRAF